MVKGQALVRGVLSARAGQPDVVDAHSSSSAAVLSPSILEWGSNHCTGLVHAQPLLLMSCSRGCGLSGCRTALHKRQHLKQELCPVVGWKLAAPTPTP